MSSPTTVPAASWIGETVTATSTSAPSSGYSATPMLAETRTFRPASVNGDTSRSRIFPGVAIMGLAQYSSSSESSALNFLHAATALS